MTLSPTQNSVKSFEVTDVICVTLTRAPSL